MTLKFKAKGDASLHFIVIPDWQKVKPPAEADKPDTPGESRDLPRAGAFLSRQEAFGCG